MQRCLQKVVAWREGTGMGAAEEKEEEEQPEQEEEREEEEEEEERGKGCEEEEEEQSRMLFAPRRSKKGMRKAGKKQRKWRLRLLRTYRNSVVSCKPHNFRPWLAYNTFTG